MDGFVVETFVETLLRVSSSTICLYLLVCISTRFLVCLEVYVSLKWSQMRCAKYMEANEINRVQANDEYMNGGYNKPDGQD